MSSAKTRLSPTAPRSRTRPWARCPWTRRYPPSRRYGRRARAAPACPFFPPCPPAAPLGGGSRLVQQPRRLAGRSDVVILGDHVEQAGPQVVQIDLLAPDGQGPVHQLVAAVEVDDELAISAARQGDGVVHPGVHRVPGVDYLGVVEVVEQPEV